MGIAKAIGKTIKSPLTKTIGNTIKKPVMKTIGNTIKNSLSMINQKTNGIKNLAFGMQKQGKKQLRNSYYIGSVPIKYIGEGKKNMQIKSVKYMSGKGFRPLVKSSEGQVRGKELGSLISMVSKSKSYVPFLFAGGSIASFNLVATDDAIDLEDKKQNEEMDDIIKKLDKFEEEYLTPGDNSPKDKDKQLEEKSEELKKDEVVVKVKKVKTKAEINAKPKSGSNEFLFNKFKQLEIRIGTQDEVWGHPNSEKLYLQKVNIGSETRQIASGLRNHIALANMTGKVLVAANQKPRSIAEFESNGMVICASLKTEDGASEVIELIKPDDGAENGERVYQDGQELEDEKLRNTPGALMKKLSLHLKTDCDGYACFNGVRLRTKTGFVKATGIKNGNVS